MFWMSAANPYGASPGLSQSDTVPEQVIFILLSVSNFIDQFGIGSKR